MIIINGKPFHEILESILMAKEERGVEVNKLTTNLSINIYIDISC